MGYISLRSELREAKGSHSWSWLEDSFYDEFDNYPSRQRALAFLISSLKTKVGGQSSSKRI